MLPQLFRSTDPIPSSGSMKFIGQLTHVEKCSVFERLNGDYTLSATFSPNDEMIGEIRNQRFLLAKPNPFDPPQYFELYSAEYDEIGRLTLKGRHIKHCANNNLIVDVFSPDAQNDYTPLQHWNVIAEPYSGVPLLVFPNYFTFSSPISTTAKMDIGWTKAGTLGEFFKELADVFGGEFHYDNFDVKFPLNRGTKKNYVLRWDKNIASPKLSLSTADLYSHVVATANITAINAISQGKDVVVCSTPQIITSGTTDLYRLYQFDATNELTKTEWDLANSDDKDQLKEELRNAAYAFAQYYYKNQIQYKPNVNLQLTYRPALDEMQEIGLGDTVDVMLKGGQTVEAKITATTFDCLAERWTAIELGEEKLTLTDYLLKR